MSDDLIKRLRRTPFYDGAGESVDELMDEAAAALEASQAEVERLREALEQMLDDMGDDGLCVCPAAKEQARAALVKS